MLPARKSAWLLAPALLSAAVCVTTGRSTAEGESARARALYANTSLVWIYETPERSSKPLGYLRGGQEVVLKRSLPSRRQDCAGAWYAVEPAGYVCADKDVAFEPTRYVLSMRQLGPAPGAFPFEYALSMGTPAYRRVPTSSEFARRERKYGPPTPHPLPPHWRGHEQLVGADLPTERSLAPFLADGGSASRAHDERLVRWEVPFGSMLAVSATQRVEDRAYLLSTDGTIVPADRMQVFRRSEFEGVELTGTRLPLGWPRRTVRQRGLAEGCRVRMSSGPSENGRLGAPTALPFDCLVATQESSRPRGVAALTGRQIATETGRFVEQLGGAWLPLGDLFVAERRSAPMGTTERWIHFSIGNGTLVTYQGTEPVFATLASPGIGGNPRAGGDALVDRTTPLGTHRLKFKHLTDDMSPDVGSARSFWLADVPFTMYFKAPFAIHVAYWHESFGEPMSGGCINVSPKDGLRLFDWTSPVLPHGWHGVGASKAFGAGTLLHIER